MSREELEAAGYQRTNPGHCSGCRASIEWWITLGGKRAPYNPMPYPTSEAVSHFATCPKAENFRRKREQVQPRLL